MTTAHDNGDSSGERGATVLIAEDDGEIRLALERILGFDGYTTIAVKDGAAALEAVTNESPDVVLLDVSMPFVDGLTVCRSMRANGNRTPVLMLTARHEVSDRVAGLDAGADDYLAKPFDMDELLARIRALLRRVAPDNQTAITVGQLTLDPLSYEVTQAGTRIDVTRTEFEILHLLMLNVDLVLERNVIYERIWGFDIEPSSRSLDVHVGYLRRKLEDGNQARVVETVRGVGYVIRRPAS